MELRSHRLEEMGNGGMNGGQYNGPGHEHVLVTIGDIIVTPDNVITPQGKRPIGTVYWSVTDMSRTEKHIPTWAIVLAILFALACLVGLLFLLVKEEVTEGWVQVAVQGQNFYHAVQLPVSSPDQARRYNDMVNYARSVSASRSGP